MNSLFNVFEKSCLLELLTIPTNRVPALDPKSNILLAVNISSFTV